MAPITNNTLKYKSIRVVRSEGAQCWSGQKGPNVCQVSRGPMFVRSAGAKYVSGQQGPTVCQVRRCPLCVRSEGA